MSKKLSYEEVRNMFNSKGLFLLDLKYEKSSKPMNCTNQDGFIGRNSYSDVKNNNLFMPIVKTNPYSLYNMQIMLRKLDKKCSIIGGEYVGRYISSIQLKCKICECVFEESWERLQHQKICCPDCRRNRKQEISRDRMNDISDLIKKYKQTRNRDFKPRRL